MNREQRIEELKAQLWKIKTELAKEEFLAALDKHADKAKHWMRALQAVPQWRDYNMNIDQARYFVEEWQKS